jgi:hypothetical protein
MAAQYSEIPSGYLAESLFADFPCNLIELHILEDIFSGIASLALAIAAA